MRKLRHFLKPKGPDGGWALSRGLGGTHSRQSGFSRTEKDVDEKRARPPLVLASGEASCQGCPP